MLAGFIILGFGLLFLINALYPEFSINYRLIWPSLLIIVALYNMTKNKKLDAVSAILCFIGIVVFAVNADFVPKDFQRLIWPGILIILGVSIIVASIRTKNQWQKRIEISNAAGDKEARNYNGIFAGVEEKVKDKNYKGANIYAIFGSVDLDLREIEIKGASIVINAYSIFGGTSLLLPTNCNVVVNSTAILGGNDNKCANEFKEGNKTIYINCVSIFGGAEIK